MNRNTYFGAFVSSSATVVSAEAVSAAAAGASEVVSTVGVEALASGAAEDVFVYP